LFPYFPYRFTIQLNLLQYFSYFFTIFFDNFHIIS
jgi:hypothetical protein